MSKRQTQTRIGRHDVTSFRHEKNRKRIKFQTKVEKNSYKNQKAEQCDGKKFDSNLLRNNQMCQKLVQTLVDHTQIFKMPPVYALNLHTALTFSIFFFTDFSSMTLCGSKTHSLSRARKLELCDLCPRLVLQATVLSSIFQSLTLSPRKFQPTTPQLCQNRSLFIFSSSHDLQSLITVCSFFTNKKT